MQILSDMGCDMGGRDGDKGNGELVVGYDAGRQLQRIFVSHHAAICGH